MARHTEDGIRRLGVGVAAALLVVNTAAAHHSPAAFDLSSQVTIRGTVTRVDWTNPHVYIYINTRTVVGATEGWIIETDPTPILTRSGWSRDSVAVGATVTVRANPDRNRVRNHALLVSLALGNGTVLVPRAPAGRAAARASSIAGVWNGLRGFSQRRFGTLKPTAKGQAAMKAFTEAASPIVDCVPHVSPMLPTLPYLNEIQVASDRIVMRSEFFNADRTVYVDGRGHPPSGMRTTHGHSIGRWEGDVLVVETTLFADHRAGNSLGSAFATGLPSGPRKRVVERYRLNGDRTRLLIDFAVEDPEYLAEPLTVSAELDYAPQARLQRFGCEPAESRRFTFR